MKRESVFIDTGGWIALMNAGDRYHHLAFTYYKGLSTVVRRITSSHVLSETYTWLRYRIGYTAAVRFLAVIRQAEAEGVLNVVYDELETLTDAENLLRDFPDQKLSYADAVSMAIMRKRGVGRAFGFDKHFYLLGFEVEPASEATK